MDARHHPGGGRELPGAGGVAVLALNRRVGQRRSRVTHRLTHQLQLRWWGTAHRSRACPKSAYLMRRSGKPDLRAPAPPYEVSISILPSSDIRPVSTASLG